MPQFTSYDRDYVKIIPLKLTTNAASTSKSLLQKENVNVYGSDILLFLAKVKVTLTVLISLVGVY